MKKRPVLLFISFTILLSLTTSCGTYQQFLTINERFTENIDDITGENRIHHIIIGRDVSYWTGVVQNVTLYCQEWDTDYQSYKQLGVRIYYNGYDWKFIDGVTLRTDSGLINLKSNSPNRVVIDSGVIETIYLPLIYENQIDNLLNTTTLSYQLSSDYREDVIDISPNTINQVKIFLQDFSNCKNKPNDSDLG